MTNTTCTHDYSRVVAMKWRDGDGVTHDLPASDFPVAVTMDKLDEQSAALKKYSRWRLNEGLMLMAELVSGCEQCGHPSDRTFLKFVNGHAEECSGLPPREWS